MKANPRSFVAFDGEGIGPRYVLLASEDHTGKHRAELYDRPGLTIEPLIRFLTRPGLEKTVNVWFSMSYDVNMILRGADLPIEFWSGDTPGRVCGWEVRYIPRKMLILKRGKRRIVHYDLFGFFECTFVAACRDWLGKCDRIILQGKRAREGFAKWGKRAIVEYNRAELRSLLELAQRIDRAFLDLPCPVVLRSYHGGGSVASVLLGQSGIGAEVKGSIAPHDVVRLADYAFHGGRIELVMRGPYRNVWHGDIRSAFPASMIELPDLSRCQWRRVSRFEPGAIGVYALAWQCDPGQRFGPFPFRRGDGSIVYPLDGIGVYYSPEVEAAIAGGADVTIAGGWIINRFYPSAVGPVVAELYDQRAQFKAAGDPRARAIKIGINSLYGKLAQRVGRSGLTSPLLAGLITSRTRATLYRIAMQQPDRVIGFATDGLYSLADHNVPIGLGLGQWDVETIDRSMFVANGIGQFMRGGRRETKARSFVSGELRFGDMLLSLNARGYYDQTVRRFVGHRLHLHSPAAYPAPAVWIDQSKSIDPDRDSKRYWRAPWGQPGYTESRPGIAGPGCSLPYSPRGFLQGDDLHI